MGAYEGDILITLASSTTSQVLAQTSVSIISKGKHWKRFTYTLEPQVAAADVNNTLSITFNAKLATSGGLNFNLISLFPPTYKNRANGLRPDLADALNQLSGSYLRFPGGNNIEGSKWLSLRLFCGKY